jgi:tetratricopeptide (TPR) repeat protein
MKKVSLIFMFFAFTITLFGQYKYIDKDYDCKLLDWHYRYIKNPNKLDTLLIRIECLVSRGQFNSGMKILDSLIKSNPNNGKLYAYKSTYLSQNNIFDTAYFAYQKKAVELNYFLGSSLYSLACNYYNYFNGCEAEKSPHHLSKVKKVELLNLAEINCLKAMSIDKSIKNFCLELLVMIKNKKAVINKTKIESLRFSNKFDTLLIISRLMDCGEFGGHLEYIKCYHAKNNLIAVFSQDELFCQGEQKPDKPPYGLYKKGEQKIDSVILKSYINHFNNIEEHPDMTTNAITSFWVFIDSNFYFQRDMSGNSKEYESLRDKIFK